jgi:hypothetical protein
MACSRWHRFLTAGRQLRRDSLADLMKVAAALDVPRVARS